MENIKIFLRERRIEIAVITIGIISMNMIFFAGAFRETDVVNATGAGQLGDFVGGFVGTFFALISVVLLTSTLRNQRKSDELREFETKYFELLRLHRDNVAEIKSGRTAGRRFFIFFFREYTVALKKANEIATERKIVLKKEQFSQIAFYCVFFGPHKRGRSMLRSQLTAFDKDFVEKLIDVLKNRDMRKEIKKKYAIPYLPFCGHLSRLGHYYRHLYQTIKYIDEQSFSSEKKYKYAKTIRAQLSHHEQALLVVNSLTPIGRNWWKENFMLKYLFAKNIPKDFFDSHREINLSEHFPKKYFEWEEIQEKTTG